MIWGKKDKDSEKSKSGKTYATGFTLLIIPNSSDEAKTTEISYDRLVKYFAAFIAVVIIVVGLIASMMVHNYRLKESLAAQEECVRQLSESNDELAGMIDGLRQQVTADREAFSKIEDTLSQKEEKETEERKEAAIPEILPIKGAGAIVVEDPYSENEQFKSYGVVFSAAGGVLLVATGDGIVEDVNMIDVEEGYGSYIFIDHYNGYKTYFRFNGDILVSKGEQLKRGDVVGVIKDDGFISYEISYNREFIDPVKLMTESAE